MKKKLFRKIDEEFFNTTEVLWENEVHANLFVAWSMIGMAILLVCAWFLNFIGVFDVSSGMMTSVMIQGVLELLIPAAICLYLKGERRWLKILMLVEMTVVLARIESVLSYNVYLLIVLPVVLSIRYYSHPLTVFLSVLTGVLFLVADLFGIMNGGGMLDLNYIVLPEGTMISYVDSLEKAILSLGILDRNTLWGLCIKYSLLPRIMFFILMAAICSMIARKGREMVFSQDEQARNSERVFTELNLAGDIQANMLPNIFPAFPERNDFDVYAITVPAKEVGGDFYDFFMVDENHLGIVIADVSGKGVPAALFMVIAKTLIKDRAILGLEPADIFTQTNDLLCEGNNAGLFVTAWMGIIDVLTGEMAYVNAGHNPPILIQDGTPSFLNSKPGFVLAGLEDVKYRQNTLQLKEGDKIFLYTDGVTESTNTSQELFGNDRLLQGIGSLKDANVVEIVHYIDGLLYDFKGEAEQFDDITMLAFDFSSRNLSLNMIEKTVEANVDNLRDILDFIEEEFRKHGCDEKNIMAIDIASEEIYVNIVHHAYKDKGGRVVIGLSFEDDYADIYFIDDGPQFDPLQREDPDITLAAGDRDIGGLGIFMVKKSMDKCWYERKNDKNIFTMRKVIR